MSEITCSVIQDLLPNYAEGLTAPETDAVIKAHLEACHTCRSMYEDYQKPVELPCPAEVDANKKIIRKIWFQSLWYLFWPCLYALSLKGGWENISLVVFEIFAAVLLAALFKYPAYDIYFDDDKKKEYYLKEEKQLKLGNGNWLLRNLIWFLPLVIPMLIEVAPKLFSLIRR